jgi:dihydrofolate reductase
MTAHGEGGGGAAVPLALIASVARNGSIGTGGELVWDEPADKRWFRQQTLGCPVIMGRKTWDSLPARFRPLPGRANLVVTRQAGWQDSGALPAHNLDDALQQARALALASGAPQVFVIGGAQLYAQALPLADVLVLTEIDADLPGDTFFPAWDRQSFTEVHRESRRSEGAPAVAYAFTRQQRNT